MAITTTRHVFWAKIAAKHVCGMDPAGELTALLQTPLLHWGRGGEGEGMEGKGRTGKQRRGAGKGTCHGEEGRGGEKERGEGRRGRNGPATFWVKFTPVAVSNMRWRLLGWACRGLPTV